MDEYIKNHDILIINTNNEFIYEVLVFCTFKKHYFQINAAIYASEVEIKDIVSNFTMNSYIQIKCTFIAAPLKWILANDYVKYKKLTIKEKAELKRKQKNENISKITVNRQGYGRPSRKTNSSRT